MLAIASDCRTLQGINHYMKMDAIEWDIPHGGHERTLLQQPVIALQPQLNQ
jgi:hypothetical protein